MLIVNAYTIITYYLITLPNVCLLSMLITYYYLLPITLANVCLLSMLITFITYYLVTLANGPYVMLITMITLLLT